jgi:hypothetical protein
VLKAFDIHTESAAHLPPEALGVAKEILVLVRKYFEE